MKILHTADIHLREYEDERWETLKKIIEIGNKEKVEIFIISGDLFDKGINAENLRVKIRKLFSRNIFKVILLPGNHDSKSYESNLNFGEDAVILNSIDKPFEYKDIEIFGIPFEDIEGEKVLTIIRSLKNRLNPNKRNILLYHGELLDSFFSRKDFGDEGEKRYMPVKLSYFDDLKIDYILAGHFHKNFRIFPLKNGGYFVYPGSPISITKRETGQRYVNIFEVGSPPKEYPLAVPYFEKLSIKIDPFNKNPLENIKKEFFNLPPYSKIILEIKGFINSQYIGMDETKFEEKIKEIFNGRLSLEDYSFEVKDVRKILEDDLFKRFIEKLKERKYKKEKETEIQNLVIQAMTNVKA